MWLVTAVLDITKLGWEDSSFSLSLTPLAPSLSPLLSSLPVSSLFV